MRTIFVSLAFVAMATSANAEICRGQVIAGSLDSAIGECSFLSKSPAARKIFAACKMGDTCEVAATVKGDWIQTVESVKKVD